MIRCICFDADDTLWTNESHFRAAQARLVEILERYARDEEIAARLDETERANIKMFGYGVKGFTLSMIETAIALSKNQVSAQEIHQIILQGKKMLDSPLELFEGVAETLDILKEDYRLFMITKGDLLDQNTKIARSGLRARFEACEVVSEKDPDSYRDVFWRHGVDAAEALMVGNSIPSDCLPVLRIGGAAAHIPHTDIAFFDRHEEEVAHPRFHRLENISAVPALVARLNAQ